MRLIRISAVWMLFTWITISTTVSQNFFDSIEITETAFEERHIRYMYNYALNAALFQYPSGHTSPAGYINESIKRNTIKVLSNKLHTKRNHLDLFVLPAEFCQLSYLNFSHDMALTLPIETQYHVQKMPYLKLSQDQLLDEMNQILLNSEGVKYIAAFSGLYQNGKFYYLEVLTGFFANYYPPLFGNARYIFEFEWCGSRKVVYPMRTVEQWFYFEADQQPRFSPTVIIPSKLCPG